MQVYSSVVEADTEELAMQVAIELTDDMTPVDTQWFDSNVKQVSDDADTDN